MTFVSIAAKGEIADNEQSSLLQSYSIIKHIVIDSFYILTKCLPSCLHAGTGVYNEKDLCPVYIHLV